MNTTMNTTALAPKDIARLKRRLETLVGRQQNEATAANREVREEDAQLVRDLTPSGDAGIALSELERDVANLGRTRGAVARTRVALKRIAAGTYGICDSCGKPIALARLEAEPTAVRCRDCQALGEALERLRHE